MAYFERVRDVVSGPFSPDVIQQRMASGWQMVSIEWRRELPDSEAPPEGGFDEDILTVCASPMTAGVSKSIRVSTSR